MLILLIIAMIIVLVDQAIKSLVISTMVQNQIIDLNLIKFEYIQKYSIFFEKDINIFMIIISVIVAAIFVYWFLTKFAVHVKNKNNYIPFILVIAGLISNIIDRIIRGFVITYIKIPLLLQDIPFNFADICVIVGLFLTVIFYLLKVNTDAFNTMDLSKIEKKGKK